MTDTQEQTKIKHNLNSYYILPLLKLNIKSWGEDNFIKSQVTKYGEVVVFIRDKEVAGEYYEHENYLADVDEDEVTMIIYSIPTVFLEDYQHFLDSKYSKMSMFAKDLIKAHATANGLKWRVTVTEWVTNEKGKKVKAEFDESSTCLMALDLDEDLRKSMEEELDVKISSTAELQDVLNIEEEIIKLN